MIYSVFFSSASNFRKTKQNQILKLFSEPSWTNFRKPHRGLLLFQAFVALSRCCIWAHIFSPNLGVSARLPLSTDITLLQCTSLNCFLVDQRTAYFCLLWCIFDTLFISNFNKIIIRKNAFDWITDHFHCSFWKKPNRIQDKTEEKTPPYTACAALSHCKFMSHSRSFIFQNCLWSNLSFFLFPSQSMHT